MSALNKKIRKKLNSLITPSVEQIYIIPTRMGGYFITVTLIILLIGSGYSNNLVNILAFFMFSLVFVGMVLTHLQLKDVKVAELEVNPSFAGEEVWSQAVLNNPNATERFGLRAHLPELETVKGASFTERFVHQLAARQNTRVSWVQRSGVRGLHTIQKIEVSSVFPLGLFYSWKLIPIQKNYWVYPELKGDLQLPEALQAGESDALSRASQNSGDDFRGHRQFIQGDSSRHIDWKAHARGRPLLIKEINEGDPPDWLFDFHVLEDSGLDLEAKLSQLAMWVQEAYHRDLNFALRLPKREEISGRGDAHARKCFEWLAGYS